MRVCSFTSRVQIFARCLTKVLHIDLWKTYMYYVREAKGAIAEFRCAALSLPPLLFDVPLL